MLLRILTLYFILISLSANSQILPDSIIITKNNYVNNFTDSDSLINTENYLYNQNNGKFICGKTSISKSKILRLKDEINSAHNNVDLLTKFDIDTALTKDNPEELLNLYSNKHYNLEPLCFP